jgi:dihydrofolate reductase
VIDVVFAAFFAILSQTPRDDAKETISVGSVSFFATGRLAVVLFMPASTVAYLRRVAVGQRGSKAPRNTLVQARRPGSTPTSQERDRRVFAPGERHPECVRRPRGGAHRGDAGAGGETLRRRRRTLPACRFGPGWFVEIAQERSSGSQATPAWKGMTLMSKFRVNAFGISIDGYGAGADQDLDNPMGRGGMALHQWVFGTKTFQSMSADFAGSLTGDKVGRGGIDDDFAARGFQNLGAWIMGRNMFGPVRGPWSDDSWKGWWGENPPYRVPVFVLTHHARDPITMAGGTTFHFVTDGIDAALRRAKEAAQGKDVRLGGGVATIRQYLTAGLIDEIHLAIAPALLGRGENLFTGIDAVRLGYKCTEHASTENATHVVLTK